MPREEATSVDGWGEEPASGERGGPPSGSRGSNYPTRGVGGVVLGVPRSDPGVRIDRNSVDNDYFYFSFHRTLGVR